MTEHISKSIRARPEGYWENTGVQVSAGDHVTVQYASGSWICNPYWRVFDAAGTSEFLGIAGYLLPGANQGAMVGKVGGNNTDGGGAVFLVGNLASVPAGEVGTLWLSVNDQVHPDGFGDNSGAITVQITKN